MFKFSLSLVSFGAVCAYIIYTIWTTAQLFIPPNCSASEDCYKSFLYEKPSLDLYLFTSIHQELKVQSNVKLVDYIKNFNYLGSWERKISLEIPKSVRDNGTFYLHLFAIPSAEENYYQWFQLMQNEKAVYFKIKLTQLHVPDSYIFNLLKEEASTRLAASTKTDFKDTGILKIVLDILVSLCFQKSSKNVMGGEKKKIDSAKSISHLKSKITINMLTDPMFLPRKNIPREIYYFLRLTQDKKFLPIMTYNFLETRLEDLKLMKNSTEEILLKYSPTYFGKLRIMVQLENSVLTLKKMGFSARDVDDIKSLFASTNFYLLCITIIISSFHLLFDFLAFKNDVKFWRNKSTMEGLSFRTVLWRAFSQSVILLYLIDEKASLIVLGPSGIATIIEFWKVVKVIKRRNSKESSDSEKQTNEYDAESMRYLSFLLYPLCIAGAIYSLLYQPHKSWYSWCIHSLVNCVYAFGFLFMLPQLFVNYRLKSVEALPWRAFMYKAFNTFIDDVFAFIITMPTAHRVACFRDDLIFLVYLYQRWLYPVDKNRVDETIKPITEKETKKEK